MGTGRGRQKEPELRPDLLPPTGQDRTPPPRLRCGRGDTDSSPSSSTAESKQHFSPPFPPLASPPVVLANLLRIGSRGRLGPSRSASLGPRRRRRTRAARPLRGFAPGLRSAASFFSLGRHRENSTQVAANTSAASNAPCVRLFVCLFCLFWDGSVSRTQRRTRRARLPRGRRFAPQQPGGEKEEEEQRPGVFWGFTAVTQSDQNSFLGFSSGSPVLKLLQVGSLQTLLPLRLN